MYFTYPCTTVVSPYWRWRTYRFYERTKLYLTLMPTREDHEHCKRHFKKT